MADTITEYPTTIASLLDHLGAVERAYDRHRDEWEPADFARYEIVSDSLRQLRALELDSRLTDEDRRRIREVVTSVYTAWHQRPQGTTTTEQQTLQRTAAHAVGQGVEDLRPGELAEIDSIIADIASPF